MKAIKEAIGRLQQRVDEETIKEVKIQIESINVKESDQSTLKEIREEGNELWNNVVRKQCDMNKQSEMREIACLLVEKYQVENDFTLIKMIGKTAKCYEEKGEKEKSKKMYRKAIDKYKETERSTTTNTQQIERNKCGKYLFTLGMISSWNNGEIETAWIYYHKLKEINESLDENDEEIQRMIFNKAKELFGIGAYQGAIDWMKEYLMMKGNNKEQRSEGFSIISRSYLELGMNEEAMKSIEKSIEEERKEENEIIRLKCMIKTREEEEIKQVFKTNITMPNISNDTKIKMCEILEEKGMNELILFGYESIMTSIMNKEEIETRIYYQVIKKYLDFLFKMKRINMITAQDIIDNVIDNIQNKKIEIIEKEIYSIISIIWERGINDCINKNERTGKEWFKKVREIMEISRCNEEIGEINKNISICENQMNNYHEAMKSAQQAIENGCNDLQADFILFSSYLHLHMKKEGKEVIEKAMNKSSLNQHKIEFLETCCSICEEMKEIEIENECLRKLFEQLPGESKKGTGIIVFRQIMKKGCDVNIIKRFIEMVKANQEEVIGEEKGEIEWSLAYLNNRSKESYSRKKHEECLYCCYLYNILSKSKKEYEEMYENRIMICLLGASSGVEGIGKNVNKEIEEMKEEAKRCLEEIRRKGINTINSIEKLETTIITVEVKISIIKEEGIDETITKLLKTNTNSSVLEMIGMSCIENGYKTYGIQCLKNGMSVICKRKEVDGVRLARIIREIIQESEDEEILEMIDKAITMIKSTDGIYPKKEIEWLMGISWNKGNQSRYKQDNRRAEEWYNKALILSENIERRDDITEKMNKEYQIFINEINK
ncbi:tetratricopeptide repeat-containing protein [Entamoeba nuttalli P19]|uniref:Tetratricopeptide repeat-containing protein n=1 Tax=Entamoeba nuttalli (strain P19) TaxID=1076696 RepID=K2H8X4_ENTNP|nr:tetratricopeptide repeat-containing protein [Entamoeba nuttalli P19]EKE43052.1 tetratricopeptide repeat-containing protein [Entamoeba nuttalli P19]|eukprot:XP_008854612.1 tetratricopeptide repeat-containing protein [Entamoeba nuttalli P19]